MLVSMFFESRVSIVFLCIFLQNLERYLKFTMIVLYLGKIFYKFISGKYWGTFVYILCLQKKSKLADKLL